MFLIDPIELYKVYMEGLKRHPIPKEFGLKRCLAVEWVNASGFFFSMLAKAPRIEAEPVRHGLWITYSEKHAFSEECSVCGCGVRWNDGEPHEYNYCPNCGCKMDGDSHAV